MKQIRRFLTVALALVLLLCAVPTAQAADSKVTYKGHSAKFVFEPGSNYSPTDLFPNFKDVMPGDTITQDITLKNKASNLVKVKVYMRALGAHPDSKEFLSQMNLTVIKKKDTVMFDAAASRKAQLHDWTYLGTLYSGGKVDLSVKLEVPVELDTKFQDAVGYLDWQFMVVEIPRELSDPKTGDMIFTYVAILAASTAGLVYLLILYRKKRKKH